MSVDLLLLIVALVCASFAIGVQVGSECYLRALRKRPVQKLEAWQVDFDPPVVVSWEPAGGDLTVPPPAAGEPFAHRTAEAMTDILAALAVQHGDYRAHGYKVERYDGTGGGWLLLDADGAQLQVAHYGGLAPTKAAAVLEAYSRIDQDARLARDAASAAAVR